MAKPTELYECVPHRPKIREQVIDRFARYGLSPYGAGHSIELPEGVIEALVELAAEVYINGYDTAKNLYAGSDLDEAFRKGVDEGMDYEKRLAFIEKWY